MQFGGNTLWSIGGGKGGIGKSIVTLGIGTFLARMGRKVILIDGDLGGANLHIMMGVHPRLTLEHFILRKVARLEDAVVETPIAGMGLICGVCNNLEAANLTYSEKIRVLNQINELPAQYVLIDLGAGSSFNTLDFFNFSFGKIIIFTDQTTSLMNAYGFIKKAIYRHISREFPNDHEILEALYQENTKRNNPIHHLLGCLKETNRFKFERMNQLLSGFNLFLIGNKIKDKLDQKFPEIISELCSDFLSLHPQILRDLPYESKIEDDRKQKILPALSEKNNRLSQELEKIALRVDKESQLAMFDFKIDKGLRTAA